MGWRGQRGLKERGRQVGISGFKTGWRVSGSRRAQVPKQEACMRFFLPEDDVDTTVVFVEGCLQSEARH
eukprot:172905-Chlamydomonas_euryale.AAC.7